MKNKLTKKSISLIVLVVALFAGIFAVGSAWAYFIDDEKDNNTITLRAVDTEIEEEIDSTDLTKIPSVRNTGTSDCIVRLKVEVTPSSELENIAYRELNTTDWVFNEVDGYYYYQGVLSPEEATPAIFTGVDIVDVEVMNDFEIILYQEAIQPVIIDADGNKIDAFNNETYDQSKAAVIWQQYETQ